MQVVVLTLLLAGCAGARPDLPLPSPTPTEVWQCRPEESVISWSTPVEERQLLQVGVYRHSPTEQPEIVKSTTLPAQVEGVFLDSAWLPALVSDLAETHQILAASTGTAPAGDYGGWATADHKPGRYVEYSGAVAVTADFSIRCDDGTRTGRLRTWGESVHGVLFCEITPPEDSFADLARTYC